MVSESTFRLKAHGQKRLLYHSAVLVAIGLAFAVFLAFVQPLYGINLKLSDQLFVSQAPLSDIVIIGIDDETLDTYGIWSDWSRSLHEKAIENLSKASAGVIGFDVLFSDVSSEDDTLAKAIEEAGNVVLPVVGTEALPSSGSAVTFSQILSPAASLKQASRNTGHGNISPDPDGTVRRLPLVIRDSAGQSYPAFSLSVLYTIAQVDLPADYPIQDGRVDILSRKVPVDSRYRTRIDFASDSEKRPYISYKDVIAGNFNETLVRGRIVLIGMTATGEFDKWTSPVSTDRVPGVYLHAEVIENILRRQFLTEAGSGINFAILLGLLLVMGILLPRMGIKWGALFSVFLFAAFMIASFITFENGYILSILYPLILVPLVYTGNIGIQNAFTVVENSRLNREISNSYKSTIMALAASIDAKDHYTRGHSQRVTSFALRGAAALPMSPEELEWLEYASILHDIGKIGIPDAILRKPGALTKEEWEIMKQHPEIGMKIIEDIPFLDKARKLARHHHERYDGKGYPDGLAGEDIPLGSRVLSIADAFDSMTTDRAYRGAMSVEDALEEIRKCSGTQFCPVAAEAFISGFRDSFIWRT